MSQVPNSNDIPSNSHKAREEAEKNKKPDITPFDGDVGAVKRKKSTFWEWFRKMFLSDRKPSEIMMDIVNNQLVPGFKDNVRNGFVSTIDGFIYQGSAKPTSQSNNSVSYNNVYRASTAPKQQQTVPTQAINNSNVDPMNGFVNPCFKTRIEAERFLNTKMKGYDYPTLSVHTMYMMMSKHIDYTWDAWGWNREEIASWDPNKIIRHIASAEWPWMIDLPQAHVIS